MSDLSKIAQLQRRVKELSSSRDKKKGELTSLKDILKKDFGVSNLKDALKMIGELQEDLEKKRERRQRLIEKAEDLLEGRL